MFTSKGVLDPTRAMRMVWGCLQILMVVVLLLTGGLEGLRTVSIIAAFPFMLLMILMAVSLYLDLSRELAMRAEKERMLRKRIEDHLLWAYEREAELQTEEDQHPTVPETSLPEPDESAKAPPGT
jgi:glycine betaine transporter